MKKLIYRTKFHMITFFVIAVLGYALMLTGLFVPDPEKSFGSSWDSFGAGILVLVSPFMFIVVYFTIWLIYILFNNIASLGFKLYKEKDRRLGVFIALSLLLLLSVFILMPGHLLFSNMEIVTERYPDGSKKVCEYYKKIGGEDVLTTRLTYNEYGTLKKQEKAGGRLILQITKDERYRYSEPYLSVSGINLTYAEHKSADLSSLPFPDIPSDAFDINYSLSYIDFPHEEYSLRVAYKLAGIDSTAIEKSNTLSDSGGHHDQSIGDFIRLGGDTILVEYEKNVW
ncbi:MAG: hypothetical protein L0Y76_12505 [Ignavibacteria bacterium]|nr:hypothetical protein [Ignavibacteria bacterium]